MTEPRRHNRPPKRFRSSTVVVVGIVATLLVALGVGTASAGVRDGWKKNRHHRPKPPATASATASGTSADPSATDSASADPSASATDSASADPSASASASATDGGQPGVSKPDPADFINIRQVGAAPAAPRTQRGGSTGTFTARCGNEDPNHRNSDNVIAAPGVTNGAHHLHGYVGNKDTSGASTNDSLQAAGTTCAKGDKSAYFWPVVRDTTKPTPNRAPGELEADLNFGQPLTPRTTITFGGNAVSKVVAMPLFLRVLTGDAKSFTNGGANQRARYTCQGFTNRISTDKYPLCPGGRGFTRISEFPSCWDGVNIDSANHRTHVLFTDQATGACPAGTKAIPALKTVTVYNVPTGPNFLVDGFPEQQHKPITDHNDFINVMPTALMNQVVNCINTGRRC